MNRVDVEWQARWELLKIALGGFAKDYEIEKADEAIVEIQDIMKRLEALVDPVFTRDIHSFTSPMDGQPRNVFEPLPVRVPLPEKEESMERASMVGDILGGTMPPCVKCGSTKFMLEFSYDGEFEEVDGVRIVKRIGKILDSTAVCKGCNYVLATNLPVHGMNEEEVCAAMREGAGLTNKPELSVTKGAE